MEHLGAIQRFVGLSTDTKPTPPAGSTFLEYDTGVLFIYTGAAWSVKTNPNHLFSVTTIDLNQAAGDYDLFTAPTSDVQILEFGIIIPADLTGAAAGSLTAISVQTTDAASPPVTVEFISATEGAKANLTEDKHLIYNGAGIVDGGQKIQLTIVGGATTAAQVCNVWVKYQEAAS